MAKLSQWTVVGDGLIDGSLVLDSIALRAALQRDPARRGLDPHHPTLQLLYNYGFWAQVFDGPPFGCGDPELFAPYWSGFGGIRALLMPNGVVYYYVSDNAEFPSMAPELQQGQAIGGPLC